MADAVIWKVVCRATLNLALLPCIVHRLSAQDWEQRSEARAKELVRKNGEGTDRALTKQLLAMKETDQGMRNRWLSLPAEKRGTLETDLERIDATLTEELKKIVASKGWPTIALVGSQASQAAALIMIHSPDHEFQRKLLPELQKLVEEDRIFGSDVAYSEKRCLRTGPKKRRSSLNNVSLHFRQRMSVRPVTFSGRNEAPRSGRPAPFDCQSRCRSRHHCHNAPCG